MLVDTIFGASSFLSLSFFLSFFQLISFCIPQILRKLLYFTVLYFWSSGLGRTVLLYSIDLFIFDIDIDFWDRLHGVGLVGCFPLILWNFFFFWFSIMGLYYLQSGLGILALTTYKVDQLKSFFYYYLQYVLFLSFDWVRSISLVNCPPPFRDAAYLNMDRRDKCSRRLFIRNGEAKRREEKHLF